MLWIVRVVCTVCSVLGRLITGQLTKQRHVRTHLQSNYKGRYTRQKRYKDVRNPINSGTANIQTLLLPYILSMQLKLEEFDHTLTEATDLHRLVSCLCLYSRHLYASLLTRPQPPALLVDARDKGARGVMGRRHHPSRSLIKRVNY